MWGVGGVWGVWGRRRGRKENQKSWKVNGFPTKSHGGMKMRRKKTMLRRTTMMIMMEGRLLKGTWNKRKLLKRCFFQAHHCFSSLSVSAPSPWSRESAYFRPLSRGRSASGNSSNHFIALCFFYFIIYHFLFSHF